MSQTQKNFPCTIQGCSLIFTNENHLTWHIKKHDIILNLGFSNKIVEADQTPTPTRFLRNCEEVGLFQDLQNVNPFDETFKKAIDSVKSGNLHVPDNFQENDSLHTPHIFPLSHPSSSSSTTPPPPPSSSHTNTSLDTVEDSEKFLTINEDNLHLQNSNNHQDNVKNKLKRVIINKSIEERSPKLFICDNDDNCNNRRNICGKDENEYREKIRESNRAAQFRSRIRKKNQWKQMEDDLILLKTTNKKLLNENINYKNRLNLLKELLEKYKKDSNLKESPIVNEFNRIVEAPFENLRMIDNIKKSKDIPDKDNFCKVAPKPILIQIVGSVTPLAVSLLPSKQQ